MSDDSDNKPPSPRLKRKAAKKAEKLEQYLKSVGADDETLGPEKPAFTGGRISNAELEDRRAAVMKLRLRGHSFEAISQQLGISYQAARRDWEATRLKEGEEIGDFDKNNFVKQTLMAFEDISQAAWYQFELVPDGDKRKLDALREARSALNDKIKAMKELNVIHDAPQQIQHHVSVDLLAAWTPEIQAKAAAAILQGNLTPALAEPVLDDSVLDAEFTDTEPKDE